MKSTESLDEIGVSYKVIEVGQNMHTAEDVAELCKCSLEQVLKTLIYVGGGAKVSAVVTGEARVDNRKLSKLLRLPSNKLRMANPDEVSEITSCKIGTVSPAGLSPDTIGAIDAKVLELERVYMGSGRAGTILEISPKALLDISNYQVGDISI